MNFNKKTPAMNVLQKEFMAGVFLFLVFIS